ncbi:hypothetical protein [Nannocystis pusilla]|uniref:hypothetical protein n=1 Tax=Nannocystis pusilla TaxID=889268 RepID=UPI003B7CF490
MTWWARLFGGVLPTLALCGLLWRSLAPATGRGRRPWRSACTRWRPRRPPTRTCCTGTSLRPACCGRGCCCWCGRASRGGPAWRRSAGRWRGRRCWSSTPRRSPGWRRRGWCSGCCARAWATAGAAIAGAAVPAGLLLAYHAAVFGGPLKTGYHHSATAEFAEKHGQGLLGLVGPSWRAIESHVLSLASGLCGWAPLWPLAIWALWRLARGTWDRGHVLQARVELAAFAAVLLACVSLNFEGGWRVGPRYLVVVLPALALGWAAGAARALAGPPRSWAATLGLGAAAALASGSLVTNGLAANLWPHFDLTNVYQPVPEILLPLWREGFTPYTLTGALGLPGLGVGWIVLAGLVGLTVLATPRSLGRRGRFAVLVGAIVGLGLVAATPALPRHPRSAANLRYIQKVWEPPRSGEPAPSQRIRLP